MIPEQIKKFNFVLIGKEKKPFEKAWQKKIHRIDCKEFQRHMDEGKNYGVQSNNSSIVIDGKTYFLVIVDFDTKEAQDKVMGMFPETFTTSSGSPKNCCHLWLASDNNKAFKTKDENSDTLAELLGAGNQVIAPGSKHPSGSTYEVTKDVPIAFMSYSEIEAILRPLDKSPKKIIKIKKNFIPKGISDDVNSKIFDAISMQNILNELGIDTSKNPTECYFHNSSGGKCMGWDNETAHCFHCDNSWNKFSLIREAKKLTDKDTFDWFAEKSGMMDKLKQSRKEYAEKNKKEEIVENNNLDDSIKAQVLEKFAAKKFGEASEILVKQILKTEYIYTTRSDIKPEIWHYEDGIYVPEGRSFLKEYLRAIMGEAYSSFVYKIVIDKIEADTFIDIDTFFGKENIEEIPVKNGILNIFNKELQPFNPNKIFFNKLPIEYNPDVECPAIKHFFKTILKEEEDSKLIFELIGFCLMKEYRFEKGFMFIGNGRNGKSKTLSLIKRFLGAENCSGIPLSQLKSESSSVCELKNRLVNLAGDLSNTDLKDTGMFKNLTGRDLITAKRKYLRDLIFENYAKMVFACNELPRVYDTSKGFWSRWILLEFPYQFIPELEYSQLTEKERFNKKVENPSIIDLITTDSELSGLLNEALTSLDNLLINKKFSYTKGAVEIKDLWIRMSNSFMAFCMDCLEENPDHYILKKDLRLIFSKYCKSHKIKGAGDKDIKATLGDLFGAIDSRKMIRTEDDNIVLNVWEGVNFNIDRVVSFFPKVSSYIYKGGFSIKP